MTGTIEAVALALTMGILLLGPFVLACLIVQYAVGEKWRGQRWLALAMALGLLSALIVRFCYPEGLL